MRILVLIVAIVAALMLALYKPAAIAEASEELVTFASIVAAGAIAAMALCATIVAPERVNKAYADNVRRFLSQQAAFWMALFLVAVATSVFVVLGETLGWRGTFKIGAGQREMTIPIGAFLCFSASLGFLLTVLLLIDFARAMRDLMLLGTRMTGPVAEPEQASRIKKLGEKA